MILTLKGITGHGKNRIREHGDKWEVLEFPPGVLDMTPKPVLPPIKSLKTGELSPQGLGDDSVAYGWWMAVCQGQEDRSVYPDQR